MGEGLLEKFVAPGLLMLATAAFTYVFGRERAKREISSTKVLQAQDSKQIAFMETLEEAKKSAEQVAEMERSKYIGAMTALSNLRHEKDRALDALQRQVDEKEAVNISLRQLNNRLRDQMRNVAPLIEKAPVEDRAALWAQTGFMEMDRELRPVPNRKPAPVPFDPTSIKHPELRRVTDKNALPKPTPGELRLIDPEEYK